MYDRKPTSFEIQNVANKLPVILDGITAINKLAERITALEKEGENIKAQLSHIHVRLNDGSNKVKVRVQELEKKTESLESQLKVIQSQKVGKKQV